MLRRCLTSVLLTVSLGAAAVLVPTPAPQALAAEPELPGEIGFLSEIPGTDEDAGMPVIEGPDGLPWWQYEGGLKSLSGEGTVLSHPLQPGTDWNSVAPVVAPDRSLWISGGGADGRDVNHVLADGSIDRFRFDGPGLIGGAAPAEDGSAWFVQQVGEPGAGTWNALRRAVDGTVTTFPQTGVTVPADWDTGSGKPIAGPEGSVWFSAGENGRTLLGLYPDGRSVPVLLDAKDAGRWHAVFQVDGATYIKLAGGPIREIGPDGSLTTVVAGAPEFVLADGQAYYAAMVAGEYVLRRVGAPDWKAVIPRLTAMQGVWVPSARSLWLGGRTKTSAAVAVAVAEDGTVTELPSGTRPPKLAADGSVWLGANVHVAADGTLLSRLTFSDRLIGIYAWGVVGDRTWVQFIVPDGVRALSFVRPATSTRLAGGDRFQTAIEVTKKAFPDGADVVYLASGMNFPDALAAGPAAAADGAALLLTTPGELPSATAEELSALKPTRVVLVGGPASIDPAVERRVTSLLPGVVVQRRSGGDRFETANQLVAATFTEAHTLYVASGADFPDALGAGAAAGSAGDPLLLANPRSSTVPASTAAVIATLKPSRIVVVGGPAVMPDSLVAAFGSLAPTTRVSGADRFATAAAVADFAFPESKSALLASGSGFADALSGVVLAAKQKAPIYPMPWGCVSGPLRAKLAAGMVTAVTVVGGPAVMHPGLDTLEHC